MKLCARADEIDSEPDSEAWAVDDLREMLEHMQEDGADARAARFFPGLFLFLQGLSTNIRNICVLEIKYVKVVHEHLVQSLL